MKRPYFLKKKKPLGYKLYRIKKVRFLTPRLRNQLFACWVISYGSIVKMKATSFCSRSPAGIFASNPAGGKDISIL